MPTTADFRNGMTIRLDGDLYLLLEFQHVKPGKGGAFVRTRLKNLRTGSLIDRTFRAGERIDEVRIERRDMQYLYKEGDLHYLMDMLTYEQLPVPAELLGESVLFMKEGATVAGLMHGSELIGVELPFFVELAILDTDPGLRGDTASGGSKPARLETGAVIQVPLFLNVGDVIRVDTRTKEYVERV